MRMKYSKKGRNTKKYKYSNALKKRKTIRGGEIPPPPPPRRMSVSPQLPALLAVPEPPPRRKSISSFASLEEQPQQQQPRRKSFSELLEQEPQQQPKKTSMRVSNLLKNEYKLCKEILGDKQAIYGEGKVRRAIKNNVNVLQSGKKNFSIKNIEENDYDVTLNPNDLDEIIEITSSNPLNSTRYPVTLVDKNDDCGPVQQQFGGILMEPMQPMQPVKPVEQNLNKLDGNVIDYHDDDDGPPPLPSSLKKPILSSSSVSDSDFGNDDDEPPPLPSSLKKPIQSSSSVSDLDFGNDDVVVPLPQSPLVPTDTSEPNPPPLPLTTEEQLKSCHEQNKGLSQYSEQCSWYFQNERPRLLSENETLNAENFRLKYLDYVPVEFQVKSTPVVPHIPPPSLYEQIRNLKLDLDSLDPKLQLITRITRNEPHVVGSTTVNFFYKCNITPPSDEKLFDGLGTKGEKIQIPFPAVVFLRFQLSDDGKKFIPHGVYLVTSETFIEIGYPESILKGIVRIESEEDYNEREKKNKPHRMLNGSIRKDELKINAVITEMYFPGMGDAVERLSEAIHYEKNMLPVDSIDDFFAKYGKVKLSKDEKEKEKEEEKEEEKEKAKKKKEIGNNYALRRFYVNELVEQRIRNRVKRWTHNLLSFAKPAAAAGAKVVAKSVVSTVASTAASMLRQGGKRKSVKYTMNKNKNRKKRNTKKRNTKKRNTKKKHKK